MFGQILSVCSQDIERKQCSGVNQGPYNSGSNVQKMTCSTLNLDLVNMNAYIKFGENLSICLFDLILYIPSTIFQLNRDGSSWVEPVLS